MVFREVAHGWVAHRLGAATAARLGRLTLNPIPHIDLFGSILFPALLMLSGSPFVFGYAKPVPVNFYNLRNPKRDMIWVAAAGPAMNLLLALGFALVWKALMPHGAGISGGSWSARPLLKPQGGLLINVSLAVFNMLPLPPLDGGRVLVGLLPGALAVKVAAIERYGFLILVGLLMTRVVDRIIDPLIEFVLRLCLGIF